MKIRYVHIQNYPPLNDLEISFPDKSLLEDRKCSIKFIVGVNGSGKSNLQRAIFQIFLSLSRKELPPFPVTIAYELKRHENTTIVFYQQEIKRYWWLVPERFSEFKESDWSDLVEDLLSGKRIANRIMEGNDFPDVIPYLPKTVLAYSTGIPEHWERINQIESDAGDIESILADEDNFKEENYYRPLNWNRKKEKNFQLNNGDEGTAVILAIEKVEKEIIELKNIQDVCKFLTPKYLKFGFLASLLFHFVVNRSDEDASIEYFRLIQQSDWELGISFSWKINLDLNKLKLNNQLDRVEKLFESATDVVKEPYPSEMRTLFFDLDDIGENSFKENIINVFGQNDNSFEFLKRLIEFEEQGILENVEIILKKKDLEGLILFSELSDGEQMFLCRMSLFHLLKDYDDALLILDEPETHFNDKWKREIVDMIDSALKDTASEVLISTHSSIVLTDVFHDEIVLLDKDVEGTKRLNLSPTFGADPSEVMIRVFGSEESVGRRAQEWLEKQLDDSLWDESRIEELENLVKNLGAGFYRGELRTMLYKLKRKRDDSKN